MNDSKVDQLLRYKTAASINLFVWVLQLATLLFLANSLALFGDTAHSLSDALIFCGTIFVLRRQILEPARDHTSAKTSLVYIAVGMLWLSAIYIMFEAVGRIKIPVGFPGTPVLLMALFSAIGNFCAHRIIDKIDISLHDHVHKANVAHLLTDFAISAVVFVSAVLNMAFGLIAVDAWVSLLIIGPWMLFWGWHILGDKGSSPPHHDHPLHSTHHHDHH
jgi:divalent metal cation (Fe/Co/Zn/Cd) transporter